MRKDEEFSCECGEGGLGTHPTRLGVIWAGGDHLESTVSLKQGEWVGPIGREVGKHPHLGDRQQRGRLHRLKKK